jgi:hypothetical protein
MIEEWPRVYFHSTYGLRRRKKTLQGRAFLELEENQAAFFLPFDFFFLAAFLAALGASVAGLAAGAAAGVAAGAGATAGAAGTTGAVGAAVWATEARARVLKTPEMMSLYMELLSKN